MANWYTHDIAKAGGGWQAQDITILGGVNPFSVTDGTFRVWSGESKVTVRSVLSNPSTLVADQFGFSVAISGRNTLVGAQNFNDGNANSGVAYIFDVLTGGLLQTLNNPSTSGTSANDTFGQSVAIAGNYAAVAADAEDVGASASGTVYIFNAGNGTLLYTKNSPTPLANDRFGRSMKASGNYLIVGAGAVSATTTGKAYIYNITTGALLHTLTNPDAVANNFGIAVATHGNYSIVGSTTKAYIYNNVTGVLFRTISNPNAFGDTVDNFGASVAIRGNYVAIGASTEDYSGGSNSGKAYVFDITTGNLVWTLVSPNQRALEQFGWAVGISINYIMVGTQASNDSLYRVYVYDLLTGNLLHTIDDPNLGSATNFGSSIAISNDWAVYGAYSANVGESHLYNITAFDYKSAKVWTGTAWVKKPVKYWTGLEWRLSHQGVGESIPPTYSFGVVPTSINEGAVGTFNVVTENLPNGYILYWSIESNPGDFDATSGYFVINDNIGSFDIIPSADSVTEGTETFDVALRIDSISGEIVATTTNITINDTSLTPTYSVGLSNSLFTVSGQNDAWTPHTIDISSYSGATVRIVFKYSNGGNTFTGDIQLDSIDLDGNLYSFESNENGFETSGASENTYPQVNWNNVITGASQGRWNRDEGGTPTNATGRPDAADGIYYIYAETSSPANVLGYLFWTRSPQVVLGGSPTLTFYEARTGAAIGQLDVYLDVIS